MLRRSTLTESEADVLQTSGGGFNTSTSAEKIQVSLWPS